MGSLAERVAVASILMQGSLVSAKSRWGFALLLEKSTCTHLVWRDQTFSVWRARREKGGWRESRCRVPLSALCKVPVLKVSRLASFVCLLLAATQKNDNQRDAQTCQVLYFTSPAQAPSTHPLQPPDLHVCSCTTLRTSVRCTQV